MSTPTIIVTPSVLLREGITSLLQSTTYKVVATAARPAELSLSDRPTRPTLAIVGIDRLQNENLDAVAESIRLLRSLLPDGKVVLVAESAEGINLRVLALSADACIFNLSSRDALIKVLELTLLDQRLFVFPKSIATTAEQDVDFTGPPRVSQSDDHSRHLEINGHGLSPRESQVLASLAQGNSNKVIARLHHLSEATVKVHLKAILRKTKLHNRTQAAIWAIEHGFRDHSLENRPIVTDARKSQRINGTSPVQSVAA